MALQISNPRIIRLVAEMSERTGEDAEAVIETALLEQLKPLPQAPQATAEVHQDADDEDGLPREGEIVYGDDGIAR